MDRQQLIDKIRRGTDIVIKVRNKGFTILDGNVFPQKDIAEWFKEDIIHFQSAEELVNSFVINGKPLGDWVDIIEFIDYTLNGAD